MMQEGERMIKEYTEEEGAFRVMWVGSCLCLLATGSQNRSVACGYWQIPNIHFLGLSLEHFHQSFQQLRLQSSDAPLPLDASLSWLQTEAWAWMGCLSKKKKTYVNAAFLQCNKIEMYFCFYLFLKVVFIKITPCPCKRPWERYKTLYPGLDLQEVSLARLIWSLLQSRLSLGRRQKPRAWPPNKGENSLLTEGNLEQHSWGHPLA